MVEHLKKVCSGWLLGLCVCATFACKPDKPFPKYVPSEDEAQWQICHDQYDNHEFEIAYDCFHRLCETDPPNERACHDRAKALFKLDRVEQARLASRNFVEEFPDSGLAPVAAKRLANSYLSAGEIDKGVSELEQLAKKVKGTDVHDTVLYQMAVLHREADQREKELEKLKEMTKIYGRWDSQLWDDAMWRQIQIAGEKGNTEEETSLIKRFLDEEESSWLLGSYDSRYFDDAKLRLGYIRLKKGETKCAYKTFKKLAKDSESRLRDDALLGAAKAKLALGDQKSACRELEKLNAIKDADAKRESEELYLSIGCERL